LYDRPHDNDHARYETNYAFYDVHEAIPRMSFLQIRLHDALPERTLRPVLDIVPLAERTQALLASP